MRASASCGGSYWLAQTSDFRLTIGPGVPPEETAQKQVVLKYPQLDRTDCYAGIARWYGHDTAQWLTRGAGAAAAAPRTRWTVTTDLLMTA